MTIRRFARRLLAECPYRMPAIGLGVVASSLLEGLGIALLAPMFWLAGMETSGGTPPGLLAALFQRTARSLGVTPTLTALLIALLGIFVLQSVLAMLNDRLVHATRYAYAERLRRRLYEALFSARWEFLARQKTGAATTALTQDAVRASAAVFNLFGLVRESVAAAIYIAVAVFFSWQMTLIVVSIAGAGMTLLRRWVRRAHRHGSDITDSFAELEDEAVEKLSAAKLIKGSGTIDRVADRFGTLAGRLTATQSRDATNRSLVGAIYQPLTALMLLAGIYLAVTVFGMAFPDILVLLLVFFRLTPRMSDLQVARHDLLSLLPSLEHIARLTRAAQDSQERAVGRAFDRLRGDIRLRDVWFAYEGKDSLLRGVSLEIRHGEMIALIGPSGCGKTTVADLLIGLLVPANGTVLVDGTPLAELNLTDWRRRIGYVPQEPVLFNDTVGANLRWGKRDATLAEVEAAAKLAHADEFIRALPHGYDSVVGSRGVLLSGGQRQRLALARALICNPDLLVLDEATSSLDPDSELMIQQTIEGLAHRMSMLIVAHRLATIQRADRIYVLDGGRIVESGTWEELSLAQGRFTRLRRLQTLT